MRLVKKSNRNKTSAPEGELTLRKEEPPGTKIEKGCTSKHKASNVDCLKDAYI